MRDKFFMLDTNILIYALDEESIFYEKAKEIRDKAEMGEIEACVCPQVLYEFFAVVTDAQRTRKPLIPKLAIKEIENYVRSKSIKKIYPNDTTIKKVTALVKKYKTRRQEIFDIKLVATMLDNHIRNIYTSDPDFKKYSELRVINPFV